jgi:hypothetical protein
MRRVADRADRLVTPAADRLVRTDLVADMVSTVTRLEAQLRRRVERQATWLLHVYHLPSSSDVRRVSAQLSALDARLRDMSERLDDIDADSGRSEDPAGRA